MGKYFTLQELTYSATAKKHNIDNTPTEEVKENLNELIEFLDGVRKAWGSALLVSSGFRCEELDEKIGGVKTSAHKIGYAVDLVPANNKKMKFFEFMKEYLKDKSFDECLLESNSQGAVWLHFALKSIQGKQRKKVKMLDVK